MKYFLACITFFAVFSFLTSDLIAQDTIKPEDQLKIHLMDGSLLTGTFGLEHIEVETDYGVLKVPVTEIVSFTPGMKSHPKYEQDIKSLIESLGNDNFRTRESAQRKLLSMGPSIRGKLTPYQSSKDAEIHSRVEKILEEFDAMEEEVDTDSPSHFMRALANEDTLESKKFTMVGDINPKEFTINSRYGQLKIQISDIRYVKRQGSEPTEIRKSLDVDGAQAAPANLADTKIQLRRGDKVYITASGHINMTPWGNNALSTPNGGSNYGWFIPNSIPGGALVGKIGNTGQVFKVGAKHTFTADKSGTLRLGVGIPPSYAGSQFPGKYETKIRVTRAADN